MSRFTKYFKKKAPAGRLKDPFYKIFQKKVPAGRLNDPFYKIVQTIRLHFFCFPINELYDIGTEILNFHCFATKMLFSFCKSIIPEDFKSAGPHLSLPSVKTRFKAFLQNIPKKGPCGST